MRSAVRGPPPSPLQLLVLCVLASGHPTARPPSQPVAPCLAPRARQCQCQCQCQRGGCACLWAVAVRACVRGGGRGPGASPPPAALVGRASAHVSNSGTGRRPDTWSGGRWSPSARPRASVSARSRGASDRITHGITRVRPQLCTAGRIRASSYYCRLVWCAVLVFGRRSVVRGIDGPRDHATKGRNFH